jgi:hypothetical protein
MVYGSLGKDVAQDEIWPAIAKPNRFGVVSSATHLMAQDALNRGFAAVALQARHPLQALRLCREWKIGAILNHRLRRDAPTGHYTVLVDIDGKNVVLHDPLFGPSRILPHAELLELWQPGFPDSEVAGNVLIGVAPVTPEGLVCEFCHTAIPPRGECPNCKGPVSLAPGPLLGCLNHACIARMWNHIYCPGCDSALDAPRAAGTEPSPSNGSTALPPESAAGAAAGGHAVNLEPVFAEIDKFCSYILAVPEAATHPDVEKQLDFLVSSKERLKLALAEALVHQKAYETQMANLVETARQNQAAHFKKVEELNRKAEPLDGAALGRALLKNLGFIN